MGGKKLSDLNRPILVIPYTHTLSHLSRPLEIAKKLRNIGYTVVFAGESSKIDIIKSEGFNVLSLFEPDPDELYGNIRKGKLRFCDPNTINKMIDEELELYRACDPCIVLTDGRFTAPISCQRYGIKHAAIVNASSTEYRKIPYIPFFDGLNISKFFPKLNTTLIKFNLLLEMFIFDQIMNIFIKLTRKYKLETKVTATNCLSGVDLTLLADLPEYFPIKTAPESYHYIGPITWKRNASIPLPSWWPIQNKLNKKIIYLTLGTTGEAQLFDIILNQLELSDYIVIITTGGITDDILSDSKNIFIEKFLDGDLIMANCDTVICQGGNGTIYQALSHGKPIIGIPTIPDQAFNMRRVEALQVGIKLSIDEMLKTPTIMLDTIDMITDKDRLYKFNASQYQNKLKKYNGAKNGADIIDRFIRNNN